MAHTKGRRVDRGRAMSVQANRAGLTAFGSAVRVPPAEAIGRLAELLLPISR